MKNFIYPSALISGRWVAAACMALVLHGCGGGSDDNPGVVDDGGGQPSGGMDDPAASTVSVDGRVIDFSTSLPLSGAVVSSGTASASSDGNGQFSLEGLTPGERLVVTFSQAGYATTSEVVSIPDAGDFAELAVSMLPAASTTIDTQAIEQVTVSGSPASLILEAGSLVDASGTPATGEARVELAPLDPALDIDLMPGDMQAQTGAGQSAPLESFGALAMQIFSDDSGDALNLAAGSTATIRIPVSNRGSDAPPTTVPLFYFDDQTGFWIESGSAELSADAEFYEGTIDQLAFWNADILFDSISINGCIADTNGNPIAGASISLEGFDYNGQNFALSDQQGNFSIAGQRGGESLIVASVNGESSNTIQVGSSGETNQDVTISDCLVSNATNGNISNGTATSLSVRLSWGLNPDDLDSHLTGPDDYHVYWIQKGSLDSAPYAQLDVDDVTSYGPEVITATRFPVAGVYHYSVNLFSGTSNIAASPARVELNVGADTTTFSPPAGTPTDVWHVFDITVAANGTLTITPVNQWASSIPD